MTTWAEAEAALAGCGASAAARNSVALHFWHLKRGLLVRIADGRATLYPLDNARYRAPFALRGPRGEDAFRYCVRTERAWHGNRCRIRDLSGVLHRHVIRSECVLYATEWCMDRRQ